MSTIEQRKADHIELCTTGDVGFVRKRTLLHDVELVHDALPELRSDDIDPSSEILGKRLAAPLIIAAMTGGTAEAGAINRELAQLAEARGYGLGLGSQRPMLQGRHEDSFQVRDQAPSCLLLGNLSAVLARDLPSDRVAELVRAVGADALCLHLNPAMELIQAEGDRDFVGVTDALGRLARELDVPVIAKETGAGLGWRTVARLALAGVRHVDVSGAGGTSWVAVEAARAEGPAAAVGATLRDWGVPTAASVAYAAQASPPFETIIATGGITTGLDVARALVLGAHAAGLARPVLQALRTGGSAAVHALFDRIESELRTVMLLCGARTIGDLRGVPRVVRGELRDWLSAPAAAANAP
jgi:isopentenyl-diphosphate delta-isomerase